MVVSVILELLRLASVPVDGPETPDRRRIVLGPSRFLNEDAALAGHDEGFILIFRLCICVVAAFEANILSLLVCSVIGLVSRRIGEFGDRLHVLVMVLDG